MEKDLAKLANNLINRLDSLHCNDEWNSDPDSPEHIEWDTLVEALQSLHSFLYTVQVCLNPDEQEWVSKEKEAIRRFLKSIGEDITW